MARSLERMWPGVVRTERRFHRPQHVILDQWRRFDTPLKLKPGVKLDELKPNEDGLVLEQVGPELKSKEFRDFINERTKK